MSSIADARRHALLSEFLIEPRPGVTDWLTKNIVIPRSMSPGLIRGASMPFSIRGQGFAPHILDLANPTSGVTDITVCSATQVFKTHALAMISAYRMVNAPLPQLIVFPTKDTAQHAFSRRKLQPLIDINPVLAAMKPADKNRFADMQLDMLGGSIRLTGTNSPAALASTSEGIILQDECCKFEHHESEDSPEAHPMLLADERAKTFGRDALRFKSSSPNHIIHPFWINYEAGTQTHMLVACPNCAHRFPFEDMPDKTHDHQHIGYERTTPDYRSLTWSPDARDRNGHWIESKVRETIRYICPSCEYPITNEERLAMLADVEEHHLNPSALGTHHSFRLPAFYAPWLDLAAIAWNRIKPADLFDRAQNHANSWLANPWSDLDYNIKEEQVKKCIGTHRRGVIPFKPALLVLTADPGELQTHWEVVAIAHDGTLAIIDWGTLLSSSELITAEFLKHRLYPIDGTAEKMMPLRGYIDSGYQTETQYSICEASGGFFIPLKGSDAKHGTWAETTAASRPRLKLITFSDLQAKDQLYGARIARQTTPGILFPTDADSSLILGHSGQMKDKTLNAWKRVAHDHFGDCSKYGLIASWIGRVLLN